MRWMFWKKKEPTFWESVTETCKEISRFRQDRETWDSFTAGTGQLRKDANEAIEEIRKLFQSWTRKK